VIARAVILGALACAPAAGAEPRRFVLKLATVAPDGTNYAREMKTFAREISDDTAGEVQIKWYWGGIAGDDPQMIERMKRGQLDGVGSGIVCQLLSPSFRAMHVPGLYRSREELHHVLGQLGPELSDEFRRAGYEYLGFGILGRVEIFSRRPLRSLADLRRERLWVWDMDVMLRRPLEAMGLTLVALPITEAGRAYAEGRHDGFLTVPSATLAYQWYTQAHYLTELRVNFLTGCVLVADRAFDRLPAPHQQAIRDAAARLSGRLETVNSDQDRKLLGGLFTRQGVQPVAVGDEFRREFAEAARAAVERLGGELLPPALYARVTALVAEYRAQHPEARE
jgi:TRAP-type C4-dicarboxylate transport system substrate-binding protein